MTITQKPYEILCWRCSHQWTEDLVVSPHLDVQVAEWHALECPKCATGYTELTLRKALDISPKKRGEWEAKWKS